MRAKVEPNDVSMSGLLVAAENSDDGRGGGGVPHRLEGRPISYCLLHYCLRSRYSMSNLQSQWKSLRQADSNEVYDIRPTNNTTQQKKEKN